MNLSMFEAEVPACCIAVSPSASWDIVTWCCASSFPGMSECPRRQLISILMLWYRSICALRLIRLASRCPDWLQMWRPPQVGLWIAKDCLHLHRISLQCFPLLNRHLKNESDLLQCGIQDLHWRSAQIAAARQPLVSVLAYCYRCSLAVNWARSICPPHPDSRSYYGHFLSCQPLHSSRGGGGMVQYDGTDNLFLAKGRPAHAFSRPAIVVVNLYCSDTGVPDEGFLCSYHGLFRHMFSILAAKHCCLDSKIVDTGVSPVSLINAVCAVVGSPPWLVLACWSRSSWRLSRLPASLGSHQYSLQGSETARTHATWTAFVASVTTPWVFVRVRSQASTALAFFMHRLWCSFGGRWASNQMPSQCVPCLLKLMKPSLTLIFAVSFGKRHFLWPRLSVISAASVFSVSNCTPCVLTHSMLSLLCVSQVSWQPGWHLCPSPPSWGRPQSIALQLVNHTLQPTWSVLRCWLQWGLVTQESSAGPLPQQVVFPWHCVRLSSWLILLTDSSPSIV